MKGKPDQMAYTTDLGNGITVKSSILRLTRGQRVKKHAIFGKGFNMHIIEDMYTGKCTIYANSKRVHETASLTAAYAIVRATK